ncbi:hypothetical protein QCE63_33960 [Caballeronia sp. LZ065]|uniref:hypothetical protein n=1 Tax=Caballeronia sp. LZ065 TaxID=3038571 RepID=UPI0028571DB6|nr:hypothetical protein [Caballeronia sp. LZ065]MDR5784425.1 hypothetical protein [Caballeronia sp. LZ065]
MSAAIVLAFRNFHARSRRSFDGDTVLFCPASKKSVRKSGSVVLLWLARHRLPTLAMFSGDRLICVDPSISARAAPHAGTSRKDSAAVSGSYPFRTGA